MYFVNAARIHFERSAITGTHRVLTGYSSGARGAFSPRTRRCTRPRAARGWATGGRPSAAAGSRGGSGHLSQGRPVRALKQVAFRALKQGRPELFFRSGLRVDGTGSAPLRLRAPVGLPAQRPCCPRRTSAPGLGSPLPTSAPGLGSPRPHRRRDWAHPGHICAGTIRARAPSLRTSSPSARPAIVRCSSSGEASLPMTTSIRHGRISRSTYVDICIHVYIYLSKHT